MRNDTKRWTMLGGVLSAVLGMSLFAAPTAAADGSASIEGVKVTFKSYGEVFTIDDTKCDGDPVYLQYKYNGGKTQRYNFSGGCKATPAKLNLELAEDKKIEYRGCVNRELFVDRCSGWTTDRT
ncbi:hypothetical protein [Saccharomonospora sp. NB11]|jgi:hypothetical protein|uniref:hypothetical protein n=1 Tax=Saccharomonospora sp. NB11 TaxID=1642298 RepID=UPI0018D0F99E|nr:hypothetical protein [Saccharomonospora sp. NB11]